MFEHHKARIQIQNRKVLYNNNKGVETLDSKLKLIMNARYTIKYYSYFQQLQFAQSFNLTLTISMNCILENESHQQTCIERLLLFYDIKCFYISSQPLRSMSFFFTFTYYHLSLGANLGSVLETYLLKVLT